MQTSAESKSSRPLNTSASTPGTKCSRISSRRSPPERGTRRDGSKTKIAHSASDLAEWTKRPEPEVAAVLDKLCRGEHGRILRAVPPPADEPEAMRYELFHDVLGEPIFEWRRRSEHERSRRATIRRFAVVGGALLALVAAFAALGIWALVQRSDANSAASSATSLECAATMPRRAATTQMRCGCSKRWPAVRLSSAPPGRMKSSYFGLGKTTLLPTQGPR